METNIDDSTPGHLAFLIQQLLQLKIANNNINDNTNNNNNKVVVVVVDAWITPIVMKKGRSAHCLHCLIVQPQNDNNNNSNNDNNNDNNNHDDESLNEVVEFIFRHSTTLGIRIQRNVQRVALKRKYISVPLLLGPIEKEYSIQVKLGIFKENEIISCKAEFDHCKTASQETGIPISTISNRAEHKAETKISSKSTFNNDNDNVYIISC